MTHCEVRTLGEIMPFNRGEFGLDGLLSSILDEAGNQNILSAYTPHNGHPAYDVEVIGDDAYRISIAVPGFSATDLSAEVKNGCLTVHGTKPTDPVSNKAANSAAKKTQAQDDASGEGGEGGEDGYLHKGILRDSFARHFRLGDHIKVKSAWLDNGLFVVNLEREIPEQEKPQVISIKTAPSRLTRKV